MNSADLDWLAARIHARRSRIAEGPRLEALSQHASLSELGEMLYPGSALYTAAALQRRLLEDLGGELSDAASHLPPPARALIEWILQRFHVENLKLAVRAIQTGAKTEVSQKLFLSCPGVAPKDTQKLLKAESFTECIDLLPQGPIRDNAAQILQTFGDDMNAFYLEAALDRGYFIELLARSNRIQIPERTLIRDLTDQEIDTFHLMLITRGRFGFGLPPSTLLPLHVDGTRINANLFARMLNDPGLGEVTKRAVGRVLDEMLGEARIGADTYTTGDIEHLAWRRLARLAGRVFRRSHMGVAAVYAYAVIRRLEIANLTTISEGIRLTIQPDKIRPRLIQP